MFILPIGGLGISTTLLHGLDLTTAAPDLSVPDLTSVIPGTYNHGPGFINFSVPNYNTFTIILLAGGGSGAIEDNYAGAGRDGLNGNPAANSQFSSTTPIIAIGGLGGYRNASGPPADQGGSGGTVTTGGGGIGGGGFYLSTYDQVRGGHGGKVVKAWNLLDSGAPVPGSIIALTVSAGGDPVYQYGVGWTTAGGDGSVYIAWS